MKRSVKNHDSVEIDDEYGTPKVFGKKGNEITFHELCKKIGMQPKLDVCGSKENHVVDNYITEKMDTLKRDWSMDWFMNPPYSKVRQFMEYAWKQHRKWNTNGLILVYAKTDTDWWHNWVESKVYDTIYNPNAPRLSNGMNEVTRHFIDKRLHFIKDGKQTKNSAPYPSVWVCYWKDNSTTTFQTKS